MLICALELKDVLIEYHKKENADYLKLTIIEWPQIEYLIELIKMFCIFTQVIGKTIKPTIQNFFQIYDRFFDHLNLAKQKLSGKKSLWKKIILQKLDLAYDKFRFYYVNTQGSLDMHIKHENIDHMKISTFKFVWSKILIEKF